MNYKVWDRVSAINGVPAVYVLNQSFFKYYDGDIILIYTTDGMKVTNIERKDIIAQRAGIAVDLPIDDFMTKYEAYMTEHMAAAAKKMAERKATIEEKFKMIQSIVRQRTTAEEKLAMIQDIAIEKLVNEVNVKGEAVENDASKDNT